jgi:AraC-like DNA-binding protein
MISNTFLPDEIMSHSVSTRSFGAESFSYRQFVDNLLREIPFSEAILLTTLPRAGLQIVQPQKVLESFLKAYVRQWHAEDELSWRAISTGKAVKSKPSSRYSEHFLSAFGYVHAAACPVTDPVFQGYAGALQLLRSAEQGPFTAEEIEKLNQFGQQLSAALEESHASRTIVQAGSPVDTLPIDTRQFVLNGNGEVILFKQAFDRLDENVRHQMVREATRRIQHLAGEPVTSTRLLLPDSKGDNWTVNIVTFSQYPALSPSPIAFFCLMPDSPEWATLRSTDLVADAEMSRLVPAMKFMQQEYHRGPTLTEIAKTVHLSPFHFHRRFTELFGLTPTHFLLECQIHDAKTELLSGEKELAKIASDCGFAHQSHFTSRFKQATGLTPTRWRRMANTIQR